MVNLYSILYTHKVSFKKNWGTEKNSHQSHRVGGAVLLAGELNPSKSALEHLAEIDIGPVVQTVF